MPLNEADTRAKLIDPALHLRGWTENLIRREETAGAIEIIAGEPRKQAKGRVDYALRVVSSLGPHPVAVALIEAKAEQYPPTHGLEQVKLYASASRMNVPFVFSSNGHQFVEYDRLSGLTQAPRPLSEFPTPDDLKARYEQQKGFSLDSEAAKPLVTPYPKGETQTRYYQDAAIRAVFEKIASGEKRVLLSLATGSGKTRIAVNLLKRISDAGQLRRALFICDRDELRTQGLAAFANEFGNDAAPAFASNAQKNARVVIATYQTLGVDKSDSDASFLTRNYPENYFSHIVIDECHRSAWGKWSEVLTRNPDAVQIGLTATPRSFKYVGDDEASKTDEKITSDNLAYFGEPVYEYSIGQGIEDGYLAAMEIITNDIFLDSNDSAEWIAGLEQDALAGKILTDPETGEEVSLEEAKERYEASSFESKLMIPERVNAMCESLFNYLAASGGPEQKTIIFCARDRHADSVAIEMNNLYARWCADNGIQRVEDYAFKCTAAGGKDYLSELKGSTRHHFIATTVDLLTTGVDVPPVVNIVFFRYVRSPIAFYQMVGRGTRLHPPTNKLMFKVYDYTNATRLFGHDFAVIKRKKGETGEPRTKLEEQLIQVEGFDVRVTNAGTYIMTTNENGEAVPITVEEYKQRLAAKLVEDIPDIDSFRDTWVKLEPRQELLGKLPDSGRSPMVIRTLSDMGDYDLFDVLAELGYGQAAKTREDRAEAFTYKNQEWLGSIPEQTAEVIKAIASQFTRAGTDTLENPQIFSTPEVAQAGGIAALQAYGNPREALDQTKIRMFTA